MLSRTASNLYWMGRHLERAENLARILEVGHRMSQMQDWSGGGALNEWRTLATTAACAQGLDEKYADPSPASVISYLVQDEDNPSSIHSCLKAARTNARSVRTALTAEMWECLNDTWLEFNSNRKKALGEDNLLTFLEWMKQRAALFRGAMHGAMLRDEAFAFVNIGIFIERADNTARILDVKYHILLPPGESLGGPVDYYQWATLLRSVSALGSYHWVYRDSIKPWQVADLLILREEMPRSLRHSLSQITRYLDMVPGDHGGRGDCRRRAGKLYSRLCYDRVDDVFQGGLHEYLTDFIIRNNALGAAIAESFDF